VKSNFVVFPARIALVAAALFAAVSTAQDPQAAPQSAPAPAQQAPAPGTAMQAMHRSFPAPTNLKVLPKDTSAEQVHKIMEGWAGDLGVHCNTCHAADTSGAGANGRPRLNFASDEKDEKQMARIMYKMTEDIKANYVAKVAAMDKMDEPAAPVTCGTCHRGHLDPEKFTPAPEQPPAGAMPGMPQH
jgi:cytochrome c553